MNPVAVVLLGVGIDLLRRRDQWDELKARGGWRWEFSRLDVLFYGLVGLLMFYLVGMATLKTSESAERMEANTKRLGEVVTQLNGSTEQSLLVLAAMREEAEAARRETAAAQKLALWVGVGTALIGAIVGGVAGAYAANVIGG